jgi:hypothetical protein
MNDIEAFEKWKNKTEFTFEFQIEGEKIEVPPLFKEWFIGGMGVSWQAACEYKNKEIDILVKALEKILSCRTCKTHKLGECPSADENNLYIPAWKALKNYRGEI